MSNAPEFTTNLSIFLLYRIALFQRKIRFYRIHFIFIVIPPGIANLTNLEILNLANNHIEELPVSISSMPKLRILNLSINRLSSLPRGFGAFPVLEVLDLSYNNLNENALPGNFFMMGELMKASASSSGFFENYIS